MKNVLSDPATWVENYGDIMYRFTLLRVRDPSVAEDLVQEAFLAGIKSQNSFKGESTEKSWLIGILKHKILDYYRKSAKQGVTASSLAEEDAQEQFFDQMQLKAGVKSWGQNPGENLEKEEFLRVFQKCLMNIPKKLAQVFTMREIDGVSTEEICKELNISSTNVWVILHRARASLRTCLEAQWFK